MKAIILLVAAVSAIQVDRYSEPLTRNEEVRAVENATTNRILDGLGDRSDASRAAWTGKWNYSSKDFQSKLGPVDGVLKRALGRINHPLYPYPTP